MDYLSHNISINLRRIRQSKSMSLEQAAEHIAANALYQIEVNHVSSVTFDAEMVKKLFE